MLFDDLKANSDGFMKEVFNFLGVADLGNFTSQKIYNKTGIPKNGYLHNFLNGKSIAKNIFKMITPKKLRYNVAYYIKNKNLYKPEIKKETKDRLRNMYVTDIKALEKLVKRNLDIWLK
jgi:hypothetical protein